MAKLVTTDLVSLENDTSAVNTINNNFAAVETAMENTLSRDGTTPNTMTADLDMNSQFILNLPVPTDNQHAASKYYVDTIITGTGATPTPIDPDDDNKVLTASGGAYSWQEVPLFSKGADIASAATVVIGSANNYFDITGTTTITAFTVDVNKLFYLQFDDSLVLTHNASTLDLPGEANITTATGDIAVFFATAANSVQCVSYTKANGKSVTPSELSEDTTPQLSGDLDCNGNQIQWSKGADVASATALPVLTDGNYFDVTGTTAVTSINSTGGPGTLIKLHFDDVLTLTHHATNLILPGAANITTAAGDEAEFIEYASGQYRCTNYQVAANSPGATTGGKVVAHTYSSTAATTTSSSVIPFDDTIPQNTEGTELITVSHTPASSSNILEIHVQILFSMASNNTAIFPLFQDSTADAIAVGVGDGPVTDEMGSVYFIHRMTAGTTSSTTFKVRYGPAAAATVRINGEVNAAARRFGGVATSSIRVIELEP